MLLFFIIARHLLNQVELGIAQVAFTIEISRIQSHSTKMGIEFKKISFQNTTKTVFKQPKRVYYYFFFAKDHRYTINSKLKLNVLKCDRICNTDVTLLLPSVSY